MKRIMLPAVAGALAMLVPFDGRTESMTIYCEWGDEIWCENQYVAMNTLKNESWTLGDGPVTIRLDDDLALSETLDFSWIDRDITLDLNGNVLKTDNSADWFIDELLNVELMDGHAFVLQDGSVTGAKSKGAVRIAAGQRVTVKNVTFENNRCDGNLGDLWEGDVGGAIRCNSNLKLVGCTFRNNSCTTHGGAVGIYSNDYQSRYVIEDCTFENNTATEAGGALFLGCSGRIQNTRISGNTVTGREDGATEGQNKITVGQGGGVYLTRHGGVSYGDEYEGFWWGRFEGPTILIGEGVTIAGNTATLRPGAAAQTNNLYLARNWESYLNAAVMMSGDTFAKTHVGLTLSTGTDTFSRTLNEEGGEWFTDDYSSWFFSDNLPTARSVFVADEGLFALRFAIAPDGSTSCEAKTAEEALRSCVFVPPQAVSAGLDAADLEAYTKMFTSVVRPVDGRPGTWSVSFELTSAATNTLREAAATASAAVLSNALKTRSESLTLAVTPGFYYAIESGTTLDLGHNPAGVLATGATLTLPAPVTTGPSAFFRVRVSPSELSERP